MGIPTVTCLLADPESCASGTCCSKSEAGTVLLDLDHILRPKYTTVTGPSYSWQDISSLDTVPFMLQNEQAETTYFFLRFK